MRTRTIEVPADGSCTSCPFSFVRRVEWVCGVDHAPINVDLPPPKNCPLRESAFHIVMLFPATPLDTEDDA